MQILQPKKKKVYYLKIAEFIHSFIYTYILQIQMFNGAIF